MSAKLLRAPLHLSLVTAVLAFGCVEESTVTLSDDELVLGTKADSADASVAAVSGGHIATLHGQLALDLWKTMEDSGALIETRSDGLNQATAPNFLCISNGSQAACQLFSADLRQELPGYAFTISGNYNNEGSAATTLAFMVADARGSRRSLFQPDIQGSHFLRIGTVNCFRGLDHFVTCGFRTEPYSATITTTLKRLDDYEISADFVLEGWLTTPSGILSAGRTKHVNGTTDDAFQISEDHARVGTHFSVTIEPALNDDPAPSDVILAEGPYAVASKGFFGNPLTSPIDSSLDGWMTTRLP